MHLQSARRMAEERNPDEFYHAMQNARTKEGVHQIGCVPCLNKAINMQIER